MDKEKNYERHPYLVRRLGMIKAPEVFLCAKDVIRAREKREEKELNEIFGSSVIGNRVDLDDEKELNNIELKEVYRWGGGRFIISDKIRPDRLWYEVKKGL